MVRNGEISVKDAKRVLRRYWWLVPLTTLLFGGFGYLATRVIPPKYTSETKVLVEPPVVSEGYVKPVVSEDFNQRLTSLKADILSGPHLQTIVEKLNLYPDLRKIASARLHARHGAADLQTKIDQRRASMRRGAAIVGWIGKSP